MGTKSFVFNGTSLTLCISLIFFFEQKKILLQVIDLNIYELDKSSTRKDVPCNSNMCKQTQCHSSGSSCRYEVEYLSNDTSSSGFLVEDVLHLITDNDQTKDIDTQITIG